MAEEGDARKVGGMQLSALCPANPAHKALKQCSESAAAVYDAHRSRPCRCWQLWRRREPPPRRPTVQAPAGAGAAPRRPKTAPLPPLCLATGARCREGRYCLRWTRGRSGIACCRCAATALLGPTPVFRIAVSRHKQRQTVSDFRFCPTKFVLITMAVRLSCACHW